MLPRMVLTAARYWSGVYHSSERRLLGGAPAMAPQFGLAFEVTAESARLVVAVRGVMHLDAAQT